MAKDNINGIAYNTKTAEVIARNGSGREVSHSDERWYNETLYRKKSGEFFLYGSGGIFTKYAKQIDENTWERSEAILPLTEDEVKQWAMNNFDDNGYKNICQKIAKKPVKMRKKDSAEKKTVATSQDVRIEKILDTLRKQPDITQRALAKNTGVSLPKVNAIMQQLVRERAVIREGTSHKCRYIVLEGKLQTDSESAASAVKKRHVVEKVNIDKAAKDTLSGSYNDVTQRIIDCIRKDPSVTQSQLAEAAGIGRASVIKILNRLRDDKKILRTGSRKNGKWIWVDDIADHECITIYGMDSCPDCKAVKMQLKPNDDRFRYVDIGADVKYMKEFLRLRDTNPVFDSVKNHGIGIPCFVHQDGRVTLKPEDVGLISGEAQGKACRIDGSGC